MSDLKIIVADNYKEFGQKVNKHINKLRGTNTNYIIETDFVRFNNGEGKVVIRESVRDVDLYILTDVSNYDVSYEAFGRTHYMMPDEHYQDIKRVLAAECGHASKRTLIMPYLYQSRQDKKTSRESLDCALALQELKNLGINETITCDVHNIAIMNAIPLKAFENVYLTDTILSDVVKQEKLNENDNLICISPDSGAMERTIQYSSVLGSTPVAQFYKQRDYEKIEDGKNPIKAHRFLGPDSLEGMTCIVTDDMIASGGSMLKAAEKLKDLGAERVFLIVTFALFTAGTKKFEEAYQKGYFNRVYATNANYIPESIKEKEWFHEVDCSKRIAHIISELNYGHSIGNVIEGKEGLVFKVRKRVKENE